jgi:hypothetical protein
MDVTYPLVTQPVIDGVILPGEYAGATLYQVLDPLSQDLLGVVRAGIYGGYLYVATDWTMNTNPNANIGGGNAWRFGTSSGQGPGNSGNSNWYEVYVQENGPSDIVQAREATSEANLQSATFVPGATFGINAGAAFSGTNWQYELFMGSGSGPGPLPYSWYWEWRQLDPAPGDGQWVPVYDGSIHNAIHPEPATIALLALGGAMMLANRCRRRHGAVA